MMSRFWPVVAFGIALAIASPVHAADDAQVLDQLAKPAGLSQESAVLKKEDDTLRLVSNKDTLLRLEEDAVSVIVNNPNYVSVLLDSPRLLILMPRRPGATSFMVLNSKSEVILEKNVIVSNVKPEYVRIRRMCGGSSNCTPTAYYYCPDGCYDISPVTPSGGSINVPPPPAVPVKGAATAAGSSSALAPSEAPSVNLSVGITR